MRRLGLGWGVLLLAIPLVDPGWSWGTTPVHSEGLCSSAEILNLSEPTESLYRGLGAIVELSGDFQPLGAPIRTFALTWKVNRRLTIDAGSNAGLQPGELRSRILLGFTYALWKHIDSQHQ